MASRRWGGGRRDDTEHHPVGPPAGGIGSLVTYRGLLSAVLGCAAVLTVSTILRVGSLQAPEPATTRGSGVHGTPLPSQPIAAQPRAAEGKSEAAATQLGAQPGPCDTRTGCASCLSGGSCVWCANSARFDIHTSSGRCVPADSTEASLCEDVEDNSCPAVLLHDIPANFRVIHVGIQKGGPEALIQLHLALRFWGFRSTMDTRRNKQGGEIKPFFKKAYKRELGVSPALRWFGSYDEWLTTGRPEDVLVETETWKCKSGLQYHMGKGRQLQWHLTVWKKNNREDCTVAAHTHYIARDYMQISTRAVMYPYISPHIHALSEVANKKPVKENLVLYDADAGITDKDLLQTGSGVVPFKTGVAKGLKPEVLYGLYAKAKVCIDMKMPGAERFVYEAALFGCCIITDTDGNGRDDLDLPIPPRFKVKPGDMKDLNRRVQEILQNYDTVVREFEPLRAFVKSNRVTFLRQVRRYFSDNIHAVGFSGSAPAAERQGWNALFILSHVLSIPFATVELLVCKGAGPPLPEAVHHSLREQTLLSAVKFTEVQCGSGAEAALSGYSAPYPERVGYVLAYRDIRQVPSLEDLVPVLATHLHLAQQNGARGLRVGDDFVFAPSAVFSTVGPACFAKGGGSAACGAAGVRQVSPDTLYRSQPHPLVASVLASDMMPTAFLCEHPVYANRSIQTLLPEPARC